MAAHAFNTTGTIIRSVISRTTSGREGCGDWAALEAADLTCDFHHVKRRSLQASELMLHSVAG